ncbi:MAG TPA: DEAD/DEAH box helicase [Burkholderiaceae bacterium]|jgi:superfamily II DNA/RNA helicase
MSFENLGLHEALLRAVKDSGYETATEVQAEVIPKALDGKDLMASSRTGSGKTAAFVLPALNKVLAGRAANDTRREKGKIAGPKVLVLAPTRELAMQVAKAVQTYGKHVPGLKVATVLGGMPYQLQIRQLSGPLDVLIATPGRLIDHLQSGRCVLDNVELLVLDEADRMLDMGFIDDIQLIAGRTPAGRQTMMFSATFAGHVGRLAQDLLRDPIRVDVNSQTDTHENITQRLHWADNNNHKDQLLESILADATLDQAVVFTSTQRDADWLAERLAEIGHACAPLHGGMPQGKRNRVLMGLRRRELKVLVATDVAARGIDVPSITHVINYGLPMKAEDYVHRIGRTGRAGREGLAVTLAVRDDVSMIRRIQQFTTQQIPVAHIAGLEPKTQEPRIFPPRPMGAGGERGGDRGFEDRPRWADKRPPSGGGFGGNKRFGDGPNRNYEGRTNFNNRDGGNKPFVREEGGYRGPRPEGQGGGFRPEFQRSEERKPWAGQQQQRGFEGKPAFAPRGDKPAFQGDRPQFNDRKPSFGGKPSFGDKPSFGGKPSFGNKPSFGDRKPFEGKRDGGPRRGGFGR